MKVWQKIWRALNYLLNRFFADDCANRAAALAMTTLLSIVPMMMVSFWIMSWFPSFIGSGEILQRFIIANFVAKSAQVINEYLQVFIQQITQLSITNLVFLGVVGVLMLFNMVQAFNAIWDIRLDYRHLPRHFLIYLLVLIFSPILLGIFMAASTYLASLPLIKMFTQASFTQITWLYGIPYLAAWALFTLLNWALPSCKVPLFNALIAGFITAMLFEIIKFMFGIYLNYFHTYQILYGAIAFLPIFLLWIYLAWVIILLGAIICHALTERRQHMGFI